MYGTQRPLDHIAIHVIHMISCILVNASALRPTSSSQFQRAPPAGHSFGSPEIDATFDYIVVGGGTAVLIITSRLAADASISVAVVEAGGFYEADDGNTSVVPGYCTVYAGTDLSDTNPLVDWGFATVPQTVAYYDNPWL